MYTVRQGDRRQQTGLYAKTEMFLWQEQGDGGVMLPPSVPLASLHAMPSEPTASQIVLFNACAQGSTARAPRYFA